VAARHVHWVAFDLAPTARSVDKLGRLLDYGDAYQARRGRTGARDAAPGHGQPWASKATDIARNCGVVLHRVERVTEYRLTLKAGLLGPASR
jgi:phosphoribosylformylglycinamidine synthase